MLQLYAARFPGRHICSERLMAFTQQQLDHFGCKEHERLSELQMSAMMVCITMHVLLQSIVKRLYA